VAGARVSALSPGGARAAARTDEQGVFALAVAPGTYTLRVAARGFQDATVPATVAYGGPAVVNVTLAVEKFGETVDVEAAGDYRTAVIASAMKTPTPLRDIPQSVTVTSRELIHDQLMTSIGDVV